MVLEQDFWKAQKIVHISSAMKHSKMLYATEDQELSKSELLPGTGSQLIHILHHKTYLLGLLTNTACTTASSAQLLSQGVMWENLF